MDGLRNCDDLNMKPMTESKEEKKSKKKQKKEKKEKNETIWTSEKKKGGYKKQKGGLIRKRNGNELDRSRDH